MSKRIEFVIKRYHGRLQETIELIASYQSLNQDYTHARNDRSHYKAFLSELENLNELIDEELQQAKHTAFEDGCKFQKLVCAEEVANIDDGWYSEIAQDKCWNSPDAQNPHEPRGKGGEDE